MLDAGEVPERSGWECWKDRGRPARLPPVEDWMLEARCWKDRGRLARLPLVEG